MPATNRTPQGIAGPPGLQGPQGDLGVAGAAGATGAAGPQGSAGHSRRERLRTGGLYLADRNGRGFRDLHAVRVLSGGQARRLGGYESLGNAILFTPIASHLAGTPDTRRLALRNGRVNQQTNVQVRIHLVCAF
jgi:hypothetical protein